VNGPGIYRFDNTPSGKPYIGKSVNVNTRIQQHPNTGKYLGGPVDVMRMPNAANVQLRIQEQSAINQAGGLGQLENKINSIAPKYWDDLNIQGPM
jgi:hypothetical protein